MRSEKVYNIVFIVFIRLQWQYRFYIGQMRFILNSALPSTFFCCWIYCNDHNANQSLSFCSISLWFGKCVSVRVQELKLMRFWVWCTFSVICRIRFYYHRFCRALKWIGFFFCSRGVCVWWLCDHVRPSKLDYAGCTIWIAHKKECGKKNSCVESSAKYFAEHNTRLFVGSVPDNRPQILPSISHLAIYTLHIQMHTIQ